MLSHVRLLSIVILVSVALRLGMAVYLGPTIEDRPGIADEISYHTLAERVVGGYGFSFGADWWPATRAEQPTAHWSFLYVLFLAAIYSVAGPAPLIVRLLQASLVGVLHPWLAWRIGNRLFGPTVGVASAALTAFYGYFVYYSGALVTESLYMVAVLWLLDIATEMTASPDRAGAFGPWIRLGLAAAAATLLRQAFLLMVPIVIAWVVWHLLRRGRSGGSAAWPPLAVIGRAAIPLVVLAIAILPWTVRNYRAFETFVLLNTNAGFVMYWGNHPVHGTSFKPILSYGEINYGTMLPRDLVNMNEAERDRELLRRGLGLVKDDPVRYIRLSISRAVEYFKFWPSADSSLASNAARLLSFGLLLPLIVSGVLVAFAQARGGALTPGASLLLIVAAAYALVHLLTWTLVRYRLPIDAMVIPFAGVSLAAAWLRPGCAAEPVPAARAEAAANR